jgi:isoleucyl-tRNA synthetase
MAADGQKLSKRLKNYPPVEDVFNNEGADALRLFLLSSTQATQVADYMRFNRDGMKDLSRNVLGTLQNSYRFFKMYADIDGWQPPADLVEPASANVLDQWMLARLNETIIEATRQADNYKIAHTIEPLVTLIDDMSNWYIRRSRRRFWKSEDDTDKLQAYATLHYTLVRVLQLLAPWAPFLTDKLYRELMGGASVHLSDWLTPGHVDHQLVDDMARARGYIVLGLAQRAEVKVTVPELPEGYRDIIAEELNVKEVRWGKEVTLDTELTDDLRAEGVMRELVRTIQNARKQAGLNVEDRISLQVSTDDETINKALQLFKEIIMQETLATQWSAEPLAHQETVKVDGKEVQISLQK